VRYRDGRVSFEFTMARPSHRLGNLPAEVTSFVGRRRELAEIRKKLTTARLVSLVGPGGVGKTRLARRIAADLGRGFADGAWLVESPPTRPLRSEQAPSIYRASHVGAAGSTRGSSSSGAVGQRPTPVVQHKLKLHGLYRAGLGLMAVATQRPVESLKASQDSVKDQI
jgi:hypothetical protein